MLKKNFNKYLLQSEKHLIDATKKLQEIDIKTILVIDKNKKLLGTITDGDIRRALLKGYDKYSNISLIYKKNPKKILNERTQKFLRNNSFKKFDAEIIPIVNNKNKIMSIFINEKIKTSYKNLENVSTVIMAGGYGKRLFPLTKNIPKPLIKVNKKRLLEYIIDNLIKYNHKDIFISTYYKSKKIKEFISKKKYNFSIKYLEEKVPLGTAGCLSLLKKHSTKENIIIHNGDIITDLNFKNLLKFHLDFNSDITVCAKEYANTSSFGQIHHKGYKIKKIIEKPVVKNFFNAGIYVIKKKLLKNLYTKRIDMTTFIENKINQNFNINVYPIYEYWVDVGRKDILKQILDRNKNKS